MANNERTRKPLSVPVLHIMLALADQPRHGYAIRQEVERRTQGAVRLGPGTLYEAIQRLEDAGLIEQAPLPRDVEPANGQEAQRRYYQLTEPGWTSLREDLRLLGDLVAVARANPRLRKGLA
jgi:DNA-binding PadR family transcriptional regulator